MKLLFALIFSSFISVFSLSDKQLPEVSLVSFEGDAVELKDIAQNGKIKIVGLWATWCSPCKKELNALTKVYGEWQEKYDVELIAISVDTKRAVKRAKAYAEKQGWEYTMLHDVNNEIMGILGQEAIPFSMIVDGDGNIVSTTEGYYDGYEKEIEKKLQKLIR